MYICVQVPMVWIQRAVCHASRQDRSAGLVGGVRAGWRRPGDGGLPVAHRNIHPDGGSSREHHPKHQTGMCFCVQADSLLICGSNKINVGYTLF